MLAGVALLPTAACCAAAVPLALARPRSSVSTTSSCCLLLVAGDHASIQVLQLLEGLLHVLLLALLQLRGRLCFTVDAAQLRQRLCPLPALLPADAGLLEQPLAHLQGASTGNVNGSGSASITCVTKAVPVGVGGWCGQREPTDAGRFTTPGV